MAGFSLENMILTGGWGGKNRPIFQSRNWPPDSKISITWKVPGRKRWSSSNLDAPHVGNLYLHSCEHFDGIYQERWGFSWAMLVAGRVFNFTHMFHFFRKDSGHWPKWSVNSESGMGRSWNFKFLTQRGSMGLVYLPISYYQSQPFMYRDPMGMIKLS